MFDCDVALVVVLDAFVRVSCVVLLCGLFSCGCCFGCYFYSYSFGFTCAPLIVFDCGNFACYVAVSCLRDFIGLFGWTFVGMVCCFVFGL